MLFKFNCFENLLHIVNTIDLLMDIICQQSTLKSENNTYRNATYKYQS